LIALANIEAVVRIIRKAMNRPDAAEKLRNKFELSEKQADAILDMRLAKLTSLETKELQERLKELQKLIKELEKILGSEKLQLKVLLSELDQAVEKFGDARRTQILAADASLEIDDLVAQEQVVIALSHQGYIKRVPMALYRRRVGAGKGAAGLEKHADDFLEHVFVASTTDTLVFFTDRGQAHALAVTDIPEGSRTSRGRSIAQLFSMERGARVAALVAVAEFSADRNLMFLTTSGTIKRSSLDQFENVRSSGIAAIKLTDDDRLLDVQVSDGSSDAVLVTRQGRAIRFPENDVPIMGRMAQGVKGMSLRSNDGVIAMVIVRRDATLCTVTEYGYAKRTEINEYPVQKRGGIGTITLDVTDKSGPLVGAKEVLPGDELMVIAASGAATRVASDAIPVQGRATQGKRVLPIGAGDRVVEVARVAQESDDGPAAPTAELSEEQLELMRQ
jgi:DNA gyrase subunit A